MSDDRNILVPKPELQENTVKPEEVWERVWPSDNHAFDPFSLDESLPNRLIENAWCLKLTPVEVYASLDNWRLRTIQSANEIAERYRKQYDESLSCRGLMMRGAS